MFTGPPRTSRRVAVAIALVVLVGAAAAFAYTERQKLARGTISQPRATNAFSPVCECDRDVAIVGFRLSERKRVTVQILGKDGQVVRTLADDERFRPGTIRLEWDGQDDAGELVPDGSYRVQLRTDEATILYNERIAVDTIPPTARITRVLPTSASAGDRIVVTYRLDETGRGILYVGDEEVAVGEGRQRGKAVWNLELDGAPPTPGTYELTIAGVDLAGNVGPRTPAETVVIEP